MYRIYLLILIKSNDIETYRGLGLRIWCSRITRPFSTEHSKIGFWVQTRFRSLLAMGEGRCHKNADSQCYHCMLRPASFMDRKEYVKRHERKRSCTTAPSTTRAYDGFPNLAIEGTQMNGPSALYTGNLYIKNRFLDTIMFNLSPVTSRSSQLQIWHL